MERYRHGQRPFRHTCLPLSPSSHCRGCHNQSLSVEVFVVIFPHFHFRYVDAAAASAAARPTPTDGACVADEPQTLAAPRSEAESAAADELDGSELTPEERRKKEIEEEFDLYYRPWRGPKPRMSVVV